MKQRFTARLKNVVTSNREKAERAKELRRVPQGRVPYFEIALYFVLPLVLVMAGAMPTTGVVFMPIALCLLFLLYRRFGVLPPLFTVAFYGLFALVFNYDVLSVCYFIFLFVAFIGLVYAAQLRPFLLAAAVAVISATVGAACGVGVVVLAEGKPFSDTVAQYITVERDDPVISTLAHWEYDDMIDLGDTKLKPDDAGYADACIAYLSAYAKREAKNYTAYNCIHFGTVIGVIGFLFAAALCRKTSSGEDDTATPENLNRSARALGGGTKLCAIKDMRMPRAYLWTCLLPAFVTAIVLTIIGGFAPLTATLTHTFITLPSAFAFVTLMFFFASLSRGRWKIFAYTVLALALIATAVFPIVLFVVSAAGICDVILNLRFWTKFLSDELK